MEPQPQPSLEDKLSTYQLESSNLLRDLSSNTNIEEKKRDELIDIVSVLNNTLQDYQRRLSEIQQQEAILKALEESIEEERERIAELESDIGKLTPQFQNESFELSKLNHDLELLKEELAELNALPDPS